MHEIYNNTYKHESKPSEMGPVKLFETQCRWLHCVECPQYSIRLEALGFFKLNDLHISTSLFSVMTDMSRDSIVDRHCLRLRMCRMPSTRVRRHR